MVSPRVALLLGVALHCASAKEPQHYFETPHQQFFALGGKETPAKVVVHGNDLTTPDVAQSRDLSQYADGGSFDSGFTIVAAHPKFDSLSGAAGTNGIEATYAIVATASTRPGPLTSLSSQQQMAAGMSRGASCAVTTPFRTCQT
jgi:hypothetical protein